MKNLNRVFLAVLRTSLLMLVAAMLPGCALSPQTVVIKPELHVSSMPIGRGRQIVVMTRDERSDTALGTRGGLYNSAELTTDARMAQSINQEAVTVLQSWDFAALPATLGNPRMATFEISVVDLDYIRPASAVAGEVTVKCRIKLRVEMGSSIYEGEYASKRSEQVPVVATDTANKRLVNDTISQALEQMFRDGKMQRFLADY